MALAGAGRPWWDLSLTSGWFVGFLVVITIGVTITTAVTWDIDRYKRVRRAGLLLASQFLSTVTLAAAANAAGGFYGTLSDLFGSHPSSSTVLKAASMEAAAGGDRQTGIGRREEEIRQNRFVPPWLAEARKGFGPDSGVWTSLTIAGQRTGYQLPAWVYVPHAYFDRTQPERRFPVTVLLAGYPGAVENWERQGHMLAILDQMMADGRIPPMILISVSQNPDPGRDSECVDAVGGPRADTYLGEDVPEAVSQHLRVRSDRAGWSLMGYSTGGYCALSLGIRHPHRFSAAVSLDGYFAPIVDGSTGDLFRNDSALQRSYTPLQTIADARDVPLRFYVLVGEAHASVKAAARTFAGSVHAPDTVTVVNTTGGHNWGTWTSALPGALNWIGAAAAKPAPGAEPDSKRTRR